MSPQHSILQAVTPCFFAGSHSAVRWRINIIFAAIPTTIRSHEDTLNHSSPPRAIYNSSHHITCNTKSRSHSIRWNMGRGPPGVNQEPVRGGARRLQFLPGREGAGLRRRRMSTGALSSTHWGLLGLLWFLSALTLAQPPGSGPGPSVSNQLCQHYSICPQLRTPPPLH